MIFVTSSNTVSDDQGHSVIADTNGMIFTVRTHEKAIRSHMSLDELFNISQSFGRDVTNIVIAHEINRLYDQFFEEV